MTVEYDVAIIGGGVTGLTAAYRLSKLGKKVIVLEKENELGGMLASEKINRYHIEKFYHHVFAIDEDFMGILKDLGIRDKLYFRNASTAFLYGKVFCELSSLLDFIPFKPLNAWEKIKFVMLLLKIKFVGNPKIYDDISAKEWIIENSNREVFNKIFKPLLRSKYGENMDNISAAWFIQRIVERSNRGVNGERLGYIEGGFYTFIEKLADEIKGFEGEIFTRTKVKKILIKDKKMKSIEFEDKKIDIKAVISTIPPQQLLNIANLPLDYARKIKILDYQGCVCILMGLKKHASNFYWTNIINENIAFGAIVEHTNFQSIEKYGEHIIYLASYPDANSELWLMSENDIFRKYFDSFKYIFPKIVENDINWFRVYKEKYCGLIYKKSITSNILECKSPIEGLFIGGMSNSYPDRNVNTSVKLGNKCADLVLDFVR